jgi:hypothetical protein
MGIESGEDRIGKRTMNPAIIVMVDMHNTNIHFWPLRHRPARGQPRSKNPRSIVPARDHGAAQVHSRNQ